MAVNKMHVISLRLSEQEYQPLAELIEDTGISKTKLFRTILLNKAKNIQINPKNDFSPDYKRWLFYMNKNSNNINQIAKRLNADHKSGKVDNKIYTLCLNNLITIKNILEGVANYDSRIRGRE